MTPTTTPPVTVVGGGLAGLVAAITCAEAGAAVELHEAHASLGGRARTTPAPYVAHQGPHVIYRDGPWWPWLAARDLLGPQCGVPVSALAGFVFRRDGRLRHGLPLGLVRLLADRSPAPVEESFADWAGRRHGAEAARLAAGLVGVATFDADSGRLSAAFVAERLRRLFSFPSAARYLQGGWGGLVDRLARYAGELGVVVVPASRIEVLPERPVIVATSLDAARRLLPGEPLPEVPSGRTVLLDVAVRSRRGDAFVVSDLDEAGWLKRFSAPDPSLAPAGESLVQVQLPWRSGEPREAAVRRVEALVDLALPGWRDRLTWRQDSVAQHRTGALDLPGTSWRDRPAVIRGDGVFLAGDQVAAPGLLSEVSFRSAVAAAEGALQQVLTSGRTVPARARPSAARAQSA